MNNNKKDIYFKTVNTNISKYGYHTTYVMEEIGSTPFGYSTGIYENFNIPELIISGLPNGLTTTLIRNYTDKYKDGTVPLNKKIVGLIDNFPVYFVEVANEVLTEYVLSSIKHYDKRDYKYLQLIFPDLKGNFPNEKNYEYDQKIF